ncbi:hypothetical protein L484_007140 [Morus notabilis]|uniref:Uncharacterized protein n=1 Tax=Morus notabilis TaxID=981085 RepID=W9S9Y1_9ROSA|nr:hypothetical protein L484_007140 [Morus notabilis]
MSLANSAAVTSLFGVIRRPNKSPPSLSLIQAPSGHNHRLTQPTPDLRTPPGGGATSSAAGSAPIRPPRRESPQFVPLRFASHCTTSPCSEAASSGASRRPMSSYSRRNTSWTAPI